MPTTVTGYTFARYTATNALMIHSGTSKKTKPMRHRRPSEIYSRPLRETEMHSKHKLSANEGSQAVKLREAMVKLQELELQSTENRVKVGHVQERVNGFLRDFEMRYTGDKASLSPEDYQTFQEEFRGRMDDIVTAIQDNSNSAETLLNATAESLIEASVEAAAAENKGSDDSQEGYVNESSLEILAEEFQEMHGKANETRKRLEARLLETQEHLARAHDEEHEAKREVARMQLEVANSKSEIRRVWTEAQEKLKTLKDTEAKLHSAKANSKRLEARITQINSKHQKATKKLQREITVAEEARDELRVKLSQVDAVMEKTELERDEAVKASAQLKIDLAEEINKNEKATSAAQQEQKRLKAIITEVEKDRDKVKAEGEGALKKIDELKQAHADALAVATHEANLASKKKLDELQEKHDEEMKRAAENAEERIRNVEEQSNKKVAEINQTLEEANSKFAELEEKMAGGTARVIELEEELEQTNSKLEASKEKLEEVHEKLEEVNTILTAKTKECEAEKARAEEAESSGGAAAAEAQKKLEELVAKVKSLEETNSKMKADWSTEVGLLKEELESAARKSGADSDALEAIKQEKNNEIQNMEARLAEAEEKMIRLEKSHASEILKMKREHDSELQNQSVAIEQNKDESAGSTSSTEIEEAMSNLRKEHAEEVSRLRQEFKIQLENATQPATPLDQTTVGMQDHHNRNLESLWKMSAAEIESWKSEFILERDMMVSTYQKEAAELEAEVQKLTSSLSTKEEDLLAKTKELDVMNEQMNLLSESGEDGENAILSLQKMLKNEVARNAEEVKRLRSDIKTLEGMLDKWEKEGSRLRRIGEDAEKQKAELLRKTENLKRQVETLNHQVEKLTSNNKTKGDISQETLKTSSKTQEGPPGEETIESYASNGALNRVLQLEKENHELMKLLEELRSREIIVDSAPNLELDASEMKLKFRQLQQQNSLLKADNEKLRNENEIVLNRATLSRQSSISGKSRRVTTPEKPASRHSHLSNTRPSSKKEEFPSDQVARDNPDMSLVTVSKPLEESQCRKRLQRQILRYAVAVFQLQQSKLQRDDEIRISKQLRSVVKAQKKSEDSFSDTVVKGLVRIQKMAYRAQQTHDLKIADARILLGRVRQRSLRLLQMCREWTETAEKNENGLRVVVAQKNKSEDESQIDESAQTNFAARNSTQDSAGLMQDEELMSTFLPEPQKKISRHGNNNVSRRLRQDHRVDRHRTAKSKAARAIRRKKNMIRQNKELSRRAQKEGYLPGIGAGIISSESVPTLLTGRSNAGHDAQRINSAEAWNISNSRNAKAFNKGTGEAKHRSRATKNPSRLGKKHLNSSWVNSWVNPKKSPPILSSDKFDAVRQPWAKVSESWNVAGRVHPSNMPASFPAVEGANKRPSGSDMFDRNMERLGKNFRSGPDLSTELYLLEKNKGRRPVLVPTKAPLLHRYE